MDENGELSRQWQELHDEWHEANQEARLARAECTRAFSASAQGQGTGPTLDQLQRAEELERNADVLRIKMDQFVKKALG